MDSTRKELKVIFDKVKAGKMGFKAFAEAVEAIQEAAYSQGSSDGFDSGYTEGYEQALDSGY